MPQPPIMPAAAPRSMLRQEIATLLAVTAAVAVLAVRFEWSEAAFAATRRWEGMQLDEWPIVVFALAIGLAWLSWRRTRLALAQLRARQLAELRLADALAANNRLARENLRSLEAERRHLARELHDELGQYSNAIKLDAIRIAQAPPPAVSECRQAATRIRDSADHLHAVVSDMIRRLRPAGLDELGLVAAVENCVDQWRQRCAGTRFGLSVTGRFDDLGELTLLTLFRLVQEGLTNCSRHADATNVDISMIRQGEPETGTDCIQLVVQDDGRGMDSSAGTGRFGLHGMSERVALLGGTVDVNSEPGLGVRIVARIPATEGA